MQQASLTAKDILDRPSNGVVLVVASGAKAGEMIGIDEMEWSVGFDFDCKLRFSPDEYPALDSKVTCKRTPQGWMLKRVRGENVFVNQSQIDERMPIRTGDIVRLSAMGPDFQFNLQNAGFSVKTLVAKYMPEQPIARDQLGTGARMPSSSKSKEPAIVDIAGPSRVNRQTSNTPLSPWMYGVILGGFVCFLALLALLIFVMNGSQ